MGVLPKTYNPKLGFLYCLISAITLTIAYYFVAKVAREVDPYLTSFIWEILTGAIIIPILFLREKFSKVKFSRISKKEFLDITLRCSPAVIASTLFLYAFSLGPMSIASAIRSVYVAFGTIIAYFLFKETPTKYQWILILLIATTVAGLKFFS